MNYLDNLKKETEERQKLNKEKELKAQQQQALREKRFRTQIKPALKQLRDYLHELIEQLNYLKPDTQVSYFIEGYGEIDDFQQQNYRLVSLDNLNMQKSQGTNDTSGDFLLRCSCKTPYKYRLRKHTKSETYLQREYFTKQNMHFVCTEENDAKGEFTRAVFVFEPELRVEFKFTANFKTCTIDLAIKNFNGLGDNDFYILQAEKIDGPFMDEMAKYITRQPHKLVLEENKALKKYKPKKRPAHNPLRTPGKQASTQSKTVSTERTPVKKGLSHLLSKVGFK